MPVTRKRNPETVRAYSKKYYAAKKDKIIAYQAKRYKENPEVNRQRARQWYLENREKALARVKRRAAAKRDSIHQYKREYHVKNAVEIRAKVKRWQQNNPDKLRALTLLRRARKKAATINPKAIKAWLKRILSKPTVLCYYCKKETSTKEMHIDHIEPLSRGGKHEVGNLCVSCCSCNTSKNATRLDKWSRVGQQVLAL